MASDTTIYHNPHCSKSRDTLELLRSKGTEPNVIEYLLDIPTVAALEILVKQLGVRPAAIVRTKDDAFINAKIDLNDDDAVLNFLHQNPRAIERPIVVRGDKAVIGRPPENVSALF